jgi:hypothetical protein
LKKHPKLSEAVVYFEPGKGNYWTGKDVCDHFKSALPLFQALHPGCHLVFIFDNSTTHSCWPDDCLDAGELNVNPPQPPKGKQKECGADSDADSNADSDADSDADDATRQPTKTSGDDAQAKPFVPMRDGWYDLVIQRSYP